VLFNLYIYIYLFIYLEDMGLKGNSAQMNRTSQQAAHRKRFLAMKSHEKKRILASKAHEEKRILADKQVRIEELKTYILIFLVAKRKFNLKKTNLEKVNKCLKICLLYYMHEQQEDFDCDVRKKLIKYCLNKAN
jgi:hypothetical protein